MIFHRVPPGLSGIGRPARATAPPHTHIGVYPRKQAGLNYIGVAMPVGQLTSRQMIRLAEIAELYGSAEVRLTVWQNLIIPNVPDAFVATVEKALRKLGFDTRQSLLRGGLIACTGNSYCKFAQANTKAHAVALADYLEKKLTLDLPIKHPRHRLPELLPQHYMGDIACSARRSKARTVTTFSSAAASGRTKASGGRSSPGLRLKN